MTNHDIVHCFKLQKTLKKFNHSVKEDGRKDKDEQERYQMLMDFKSTWILKIQQTENGFLVHQR